MSITTVKDCSQLTIVNSPPRDLTVSLSQVTKQLPNVSHKQLQNICLSVVETATSQSNELKNAVLTHLKELNTMMMESTYHKTELFEGTPLYELARVLKGLCPYSVPIPGHPKEKGANARGGKVLFRLGSSNSTVGRKKKTDKCSFCLGDDNTNSKESCKRVSSCKLIITYGQEFPANDVSTAANIVNIGTIQGRDDFINLKKINGSNFACHKFIRDALPKDTRHILIKGYVLSEKEDIYLLCTCLNSSGRVLTMTVGDKSVIYENVFFLTAVVVASVGKLKYVFWKPLDILCAKREYETKSLHTDNERKNVPGKRKGKTVENEMVAKKRKKGMVEEPNSHVSLLEIRTLYHFLNILTFFMYNSQTQQNETKSLMNANKRKNISGKTKGITVEKKKGSNKRKKKKIEEPNSHVSFLEIQTLYHFLNIFTFFMKISQSKYDGSATELRVELKSRELVVTGTKAVMKARLIEHDKYAHIEWGKEAPNMGGWASEEESYDGPTIDEIIQPGDLLTFGFCDVANGSVTISRTERVIQVRAGTNGTGHNESVIMSVDKMPHPITGATIIRRAKYLNKNGVLVQVPKNEGKSGYLEDFQQLITGEHEGGVKELMVRQGKAGRKSFNQASQRFGKNMQEKTGMTLETVEYGSQKTNSSPSNGVSFIVNSYYIILMYRLITIPFHCNNIDKQQKQRKKQDKKQSRTKSKKKHVRLGDVGYVFKKRFDTGWFTGEVKQIRLGAKNGKTRRVRYTDGDIEDLSVQELHNLSTSAVCSALGG